MRKSQVKAPKLLEVAKYFIVDTRKLYSEPRGAGGGTQYCIYKWIPRGTFLSFVIPKRRTRKKRKTPWADSGNDRAARIDKELVFLGKRWW